MSDYYYIMIDIVELAKDPVYVEITCYLYLYSIAVECAPSRSLVEGCKVENYL